MHVTASKLKKQIQQCFMNKLNVFFLNHVMQISLLIHRMMLAAFAGKIKAVELLREHGARWEMRDKGGSTAFHWAIDGQHLETVEWCLDDGWDVNVKDTGSHWTPLLRCGELSLSIL